MKPEIHDQSLMPALQSVWFIPHVTVYMFSYSVLGCAFIIALTGLFRHKEGIPAYSRQSGLRRCRLSSIGMLLGSLWAKEAWGNYWSWDPKETWAAITWMGYLLYIHLRLFRRNRTENTLRPAHSLLPCFTNVLVWSQLPAGGPTKRTFI